MAVQEAYRDLQHVSTSCRLFAVRHNWSWCTESGRTGRQQVPVAVFLVHGIFHVGYTAITAVAKEWAIAQNNQRIEVNPMHQMLSRAFAWQLR